MLRKDGKFRNIGPRRQQRYWEWTAEIECMGGGRRVEHGEYVWGACSEPRRGE